MGKKQIVLSSSTKKTVFYAKELTKSERESKSEDTLASYILAKNPFKDYKHFSKKEESNFGGIRWSRGLSNAEPNKTHCSTYNTTLVVEGNETPHPIDSFLDLKIPRSVRNFLKSS